MINAELGTYFIAQKKKSSEGKLKRAVEPEFEDIVACAKQKPL